MTHVPPIDRYVLEGRIVTMGSAGVIEHGALYVDGGKIEAVQSASDPRPDPKYVGAARIRTGGTIYPGMIELHNHLSYNAMPLWDVPRRYTNNGQWRGSDGYTRDITKPTQVLGQTDGVAHALVRYVECRALLGGVTTTQGITLAQANGIQKLYKGVVRNVEQPMDPRLQAAGTNIANPKPGGAAQYLANKLNKNSCYLQHLSEGTDPTAREWFLRLRIDEDQWAVRDSLCAIHATALSADDFVILARGEASIVWSPLSNYLLYGATLDLAAAKSSGVPISLGCDWAPSGSKSLLGELKVAWLASQEHGGVFTSEELVAMVTRTPARSMKWDSLLGTLEPGKLADLLVVNGQDGDPYMKLIEARETSLTLVMIGGVPRVGQRRLMDAFWEGPLDAQDDVERYRLARTERYVYLAAGDSEDPLQGISLGAATETLRDAMRRLPELATQVDTAIALAVASGGPAFAGGVADRSGAVWRVVGDFEENDLRRAADDPRAFLAAAQPYAYWVTEPMTLDPPTVVEDRNHLRTLMAARNLPEFVKKGLPRLFGETLPIPESVGFLETSPEPVAEQLRTTAAPLGVLLRSFGELTLEERRRIVDQALLLLVENYVHLPLKRAMHGVDPVQRLRLLRYRLEESSDATMAPEIEFHSEMVDIFNSLRDLHTGYRLPAPFGTKVAWLPFLIEEVFERGARRYILTRWVANAWPNPAMEGAEVTHWNGVPIDTAVARNGDREAGSNDDARHARGLNGLTIRPLARSRPPEEDWVTLRWRDDLGQFHESRHEWLVFEPGTQGVGPSDLLKEASALGIDDHTDDVQQARKVLYAAQVADAEQRANGQQLARAFASGSGELETRMPGVFRAFPVTYRNVTSPDAETYGFIRIFTFNVSDADAFVAEFVRLVEQLPERGLIIDVRGNGGGLIYAAEQLLEVLTPQEIEPERAQFISTPLNLAICRNHGQSTRFAELELAPWIESLHASTRTGAAFSLSFPITPTAVLNRVGQRYHGPVVLIIDALCYSATDMFAAGFQDHKIGKIIGVANATGAGGANVWSHSLLRALMEPDNAPPGASPYVPLPKGCDLRVAVRRTTRVKDHAGDVLEDLGVVPDVVHRMTRRDVLEQNVDLIDRGIELLALAKPRSLRIARIERHDGRPPTVHVETQNLTRIDAVVDGRHLATRDVSGAWVRVELAEVLSADVRGSVELRLFGFDGATLVAGRRERIEL